MKRLLACLIFLGLATAQAQEIGYSPALDVGGVWYSPAGGNLGEVQILGTQIGTADSGPTGTANLLNQAQTRDAPDWITPTQPGCVSVTGGASDPLGGSTAYNFVELVTTTCVHRLRQGIIKAASAIQYTYSDTIKQGSRTRAAVIIGDSGTSYVPGTVNTSINGANGAFAVINLATCTQGVAATTFGAGFSGASATFAASTNGYCRITITATSSTATTLIAETEPDSGSGAGALSNNYIGNGSNAILLGCAQLEQAASATACNATTSNGHLVANLINGDVTDYWEGPVSQSWAGVDAGVGNTVTWTRYRFSTRQGAAYIDGVASADFENLVNGSVMQVSNDPAFGSGVTTVDTLPAQPPYYQRFWTWERQSVSQPTRAARVMTPAGAYGNLAELQLFGSYTTAVSAKPVAPSISPNGGRFPSGSTPVSISSLTRPASFLYTTDGSTPACPATGTVYTGTFTLSPAATTTVKAIACDAALSTPASSVVSAVFHNYGFKPNDDWFDNNGNLTEAHSGHVLGPINGYYYWVGTSMDLVSSSPNVITGYIGGQGRLPRTDRGMWLYKSSDLYNWQIVGNILAPPVNGSVTWVSVLRPHILFNAANGNYVMWAHCANILDATDRACVATTSGSNIESGWSWVNTNLNPDGVGFKDCTLFLDSDGVTAYTVYTIGSQNGIRISRLNSAYTANDGVNTLAMAATAREAPQLFKIGLTYFLITSVSNFYDSTSTFDEKYITTTAATPLSGWSANPGSGTVLYASDPTGGQFNAQGSFVLIPQGKTQFFWGADFWTPSPLYNSRQVWLPITQSDATHIQVSIPATWDLSNLN